VNLINSGQIADRFDGINQNNLKGGLYSADEVFITSTTREIMPITNIDLISIGYGKVGNITHNLIHDFRHLKTNY
jgi:branched-subunit amino acid aminotransferase/4-amino-4-deoxychorismate lyase